MGETGTAHHPMVDSSAPTAKDAPVPSVSSAEVGELYSAVTRTLWLSVSLHVTPFSEMGQGCICGSGTGQGGRRTFRFTS